MKASIIPTSRTLLPAFVDQPPPSKRGLNALWAFWPFVLLAPLSLELCQSPAKTLLPQSSSLAKSNHTGQMGRNRRFVGTYCEVSIKVIRLKVFTTPKREKWEAERCERLEVNLKWFGCEFSHPCQDNTQPSYSTFYCLRKGGDAMRKRTKAEGNRSCCEDIWEKHVSNSINQYLSVSVLCLQYYTPFSYSKCNCLWREELPPVEIGWRQLESWTQDESVEEDASAEPVAFEEMGDKFAFKAL